MRTDLRVVDASCGHCKATIESVVGRLEDVATAELDLATNVLTVQHAETVDAQAIADAVGRAGYTPERLT